MQGKALPAPCIIEGVFFNETEEAEGEGGVGGGDGGRGGGGGGGEGAERIVGAGRQLLDARDPTPKKTL